MIAPLSSPHVSQHTELQRPLVAQTRQKELGEKQGSLEQKTKEAALQFEQIMIRQLLEPMEKSLSKSFGGGSNSPMIGGMILSSLSQSITDGGGLGLAHVIEEALRSSSPAPVSVGAEAMTQQPFTAAEEET